MSTDYHDQLDTLLGGLRIDPARRQISLLRTQSVVEYQADALRPTLTGVLYQHFYNAAADRPLTASLSPDTSFEDELSRHNHSVEHFDAPWTVEAIDQAGVIYATKGNWKRTLMAGEYVNDAPRRGPLSVGDALRLLVRAEQRNAQSGFYYVFGQTPGDDSAVLQTRLYFHLKPDGAAPLVSYLTRTLNAYRVPFQFKCLNHPQLYGRQDSAVLYLQKPLVSFVLHKLAEDLPQLAPYLDPSVPLFTRRLAPGLAFAESPPNPGESFGTSRCGLLAQGIANAVDAQQPAEQYTQSIRSVFGQIGLSLDHPYLNPRSQYPYQFPTAFAQNS